jgi:hypothetical protein
MTLAPALMELAEAMPATEELGLSWQLRQSMVELPAMIAEDLAHEAKEPHLLPVFKLVATLELIDKIYPALDTGKARTAVDKLAERLMGVGFDERTHGKTAPPRPEAPDQGITHASTPTAATPMPHEQHQASPASVPVLESPPAHPSVSVPVQSGESTEDPNVHQDSGQ